VKDHVTKDIKKSAEEEFEIKILRDGTWLHQGSPIKRMALVKLFATVLSKDEDGQHWLKTPVEKGRIDVEDSAYVSTSVKRDGSDIRVTSNIDKSYKISKEFPLIVRDAVPYLEVEKNLEVRIARTHYYDLVKWAEKNKDEIGIKSDGLFFRLGKAEA